MPDVVIKTPNLDDIFEKWKNKANRTAKKKLEKEFGTKGSVFSLNQISAAEFVVSNMKEGAVYFAIQRTVAPATEKDEIIVPVQRLSKETFYSLKGQKIIKENWKGPESVPMVESIKGVPCNTCRGKGFTQTKCKSCKGTGKLQTKITVLVGEDQKKETKIIDSPCDACYGTGNLDNCCKECGGAKNLYKYQVLPVPFQKVITGIPILHSSGSEKKIERELEKDLHQLFKEVEGIKFSDFKTLDQKAQGSLGYWNNNIKKMVSATKSDYQKYEKDKDAKVVTQLHLYPMIILNCTTRRGSKFDIYSIGSAQKFITDSNF